MSEAIVVSPAPLPPIRTAAEHFALAGADSCAVSILPNGLVLVGGKGGDCVMSVDHWERYRTMARRWFATPRDQAGVQVQGLHIPWHVSLGAAKAEAEQVRDLLNTAQQTLSVEDYGDALEGARRKQARLLQHLQALEAQLKQTLEGGAAR